MPIMSEATMKPCNERQIIEPSSQYFLTFTSLIQVISSLTLNCPGGRIEYASHAIFAVNENLPIIEARPPQYPPTNSLQAQ